MRRISSLFLPLLALAASPVSAQSMTVIVIEVVEEEWVSVDETGGERFVPAPPAPVPAGIARFGPFRVIDGQRAALVDVTDSRSPAHFEAMVKAYPGIERLDLVDCPGTEDDRANLKLGRLIHARGMTTHVPSGGSVRSGGVELFLAGARRSADHGAEFAVHSWEDEDGRQATDYPADAPENRKYLDYYREMGLADAEARAFYAMTNSVPFEQARWFGAGEMARWVRLDNAPAGKVQEVPTVAISSLDSTRALR